MASLKQIERIYRDVIDAEGRPVELQLVMDNCLAHKHTNVKGVAGRTTRGSSCASARTTLLEGMRVRMASLHLVEVWLGIVERQAIRCGLKSVNDLDTES